MPKYIIAIDQGTQSTKLSIFDTDGNEITKVANSLQPLTNDQPGIAEHPADDLWTSLQTTAQQLMAQFTGDVADIIGIGVGSVRFDRVYIAANGELAQPALSWMDKRVEAPFNGDDPAVRYITADTGYITMRLTGNKVDTVANYMGIWPIDVDKWKWSVDEALWKYFPAYHDKLFDLVLPSELLGHITAEAASLTSLPAGLPVFATANDKAVEALGAGLIKADELLVSLGTYTTSMMTGEKNYGTGLTDAFWSNMADQPHRYLYESGGIRRGMWTISWFKDLFGPELDELLKSQGTSMLARLNEEAAVVPAGSDGLVALMDWLPPLDKKYRRGGLIGFDNRHGRGHIFRAIMEGLALTMFNYSTHMIEQLKRQPSAMIVTGGGSNSDLFMQILADVYNIPTRRNVINGAASLGAAINVAIGANVYPDYDTAIESMVRTDRTFQPDSTNVARYQQIAVRYQQLYTDLDPVFKTANPENEA